MADLSGRVLGGFILREQIGKGGFGKVYRCEQPVLKRFAVIKVLHERQSDEISQERFLREAQLASRLDHPFAAHVYDFGVEPEDGLRWLAMELVDGIPLDRWLHERGPMPLEQFVPFFERVAQVVRAAHERGIVHRDLKPSNIMVIEHMGDLIPKLLDFGIAKDHEVSGVREMPWPDGAPAEDREQLPAPDRVATARIRRASLRTPRAGTNPMPSVGPPELTGPGAGMGSWDYMSPEQWTNACAVGPESDIYSLGVIVFEVLTGHVPFTAETADEYYQCHLDADVPPLGGDFSERLDRAIRRALAKSPTARYSDATELAAALRAALRSSEREQLRTSAQQWADRARAPGLLWGRDVLTKLERGIRQVPSDGLSELESSFLVESRRRAQRIAWTSRTLIGFAVVGMVGIAAMRTWLAEEQTRLAQEQAQRAEDRAHAAERLVNATTTQAELEQGRAALLHGEPEAQDHLGEAYRRDPTPSTAFMFARALQPRLQEQARLRSTFERMWSAAFSPDGKQLVTTDDKNAQLWDARTYRLMFTLPHGDTIYQAVYSVDGARLVTSGGDGAVRIWDTSNGKLVHELRYGGAHTRYYVLALSSDGRLVAAADRKVAHVWDANTGEPLAESRDKESDFSSLAFSFDHRWLAISGGNDVRVIDTQTWLRARTIPGPSNRGLSWDPSGSRLLTGTAQGDVSIWAIPSGERVHHLREVGEAIDAVAYSADGQLVVAASRDGVEQVWDTSGKLQSQGNWLHGKTFSVEFDRASKLVVAAGASGSVVVSDALRGMPVAVLEGPRNVVKVARFDPSGARVVGASWDGTARIWDATPPYLRWQSTPISDDCGLITSLEPDRRFVAVGCIDHPTRIWDTAHDQLLAELPSVSQVGGDFASAFPAVSATGDRAAIARGTMVDIYELPSRRLLRTVRHGAAVNAVAFASTGRDLISGAIDGSLLWTRADTDPVPLPALPRGVDVAGFLPDGRIVAAAGKQLRIYDSVHGLILKDLALEARVRTLRMSTDGRHLITVPSFTGKAASPELWDVERYQRIALLQAQGRAYSARFLADGQVLTACSDGAARLWDGETGRLRQTYHGGSRFLVDGTLSPDGSVLIAGGDDGLLRFWDAASGRPLWTMLAHNSRLVGVHVEGEDIVTRGFSGDISRWHLPASAQVIAACHARDTCDIVPR